MKKLSIIVSLLFVFILACNNNTSTEEKSCYSDRGNGICFIYAHHCRNTELAFTNWKTDFPQRYKNIISIACDGHPSRTIYIFYRTESELE